MNKIKLDWMNQLRRLEANNLLSYESKFNMLKAYGTREEKRINLEFTNDFKQLRLKKQLEKDLIKEFNLHEN